MKIKTLAYFVLIAASGLLIYSIFHLNSDDPEKVSITSIIGNILIIVAITLTIMGQHKKDRNENR
jgi:hypothetical protein